MKAAIYTEYGPPAVLHLQEIPKPTPKENEILVRVAATAVNYGDLVARNFKNISHAEFNMPTIFMFPARFSFGWRKPKNPILGNEFSGVVEAVGHQVTRFKPGDPVFGYRGMNMGANVEYLCMPETGTVAIKPANLSHAETAVIPGALIALNILKKVNIRPGQKLLINGASGSIGSAALQLAKAQGAHVTGVCGTPRLAFVQALGADAVIDYTKEDFTQNGKTYDLILDVLGKSSFARCQNSLKPGGIYLLASFKMKAVFQMLWTSIVGDKRG
ncbi:MAG: NAD(P)-dependent alcohol dehydrogenase [Chloroflexi bacterium]|nr:NAD(P)-dependent alcohol dehydrogenase [Ardenticatenaceae bacterium]MBL1128991.1 NAD(P)-dependent alcohol dehydrogenase [Chloroflexota bacterium]NOG35069.1 NAD(P)-dependent alcohol dehydrogenase [Chloroflexota bacterium]GIK59044.1 MAG: alcohol dehydrogenase [Chloroflexota bacterium]